MIDEPKDSELASIAASWAAPAPTGSFHSRVARAYASEFPRDAWWKRRSGFGALGKVLLAVATGSVCLLVIAAAFPQTSRLAPLWFKVPCIVDFEFLTYAPDGKATTVAFFTAYPRDGREIILSSSFPDNPLKTLKENILNPTALLLYQLSLPFRDPRQAADRATFHAKFLSAGCTHGNSVQRESVLGGDSILGFTTTIVRYNWPAPAPKGRTTEWRAPDLNCLTLRYFGEEQRADGTYRRVNERRVLKVSVNP